MDLSSMIDLEGIYQSAKTKIVNTVFDELPTSVKINLNPIKDYLLESKRPDSIRDIVELTGKNFRKEVMYFDDKNKNFHQY